VGFTCGIISDSPPSLEVVAHSDAFGAYGSDAPVHITVYYPTPSSFVFAAGTIEWGAGARCAGIRGRANSANHGEPSYVMRTFIPEIPPSSRHARRLPTSETLPA